jgi:hypothetical protein
MGLDGVEIVMSVEDAFGITISDAEAVACTTPAKLSELVVSKVAVEDLDDTCLTQRAFYLLRRSYLEISDARRNSFKLKTPLRSLAAGHEKLMDKWKANLGLSDFPSLSWPRWKVTLVLTMLIGIGVASGILAESLGVGIGVAVLAGLAIAFSQRKFKRAGTVNDLVFYMIRFHPGKVKVKANTWTKKEVRTLINSIITEQTGILKFDDNASFVKDLAIS